MLCCCLLLTKFNEMKLSLPRQYTMICPGAVPAPGQMHIARLNVSCVASNGRGGGQSQDRQRGDGDPRALDNRDSMSADTPTDIAY